MTAIYLAAPTHSHRRHFALIRTFLLISPPRPGQPMSDDRRPSASVPRAHSGAPSSPVCEISLAPIVGTQKGIIVLGGHIF